MKLLFVHGTKIKEDENGIIYTGGSYNQEVWDRYLSITRNLSVMARKESFVYKVDDAKEKFNYFDKEKIGFVEVPNLFSSIRDYFDIRKRIDINRIIRDEVIKNDFLIARLPSTFGNIAIKFAKEYNKPYLVEIVGCIWDALWNHSSKGKILAFPSYIAMKKSVINAPYVVYVSQEFLQKRYPSKGKTIGCSDVSLPTLNENILEKRVNKINKMGKDKPILIGTAAAVDVKYKGQEYVIKAISKLNKEGHNFEYYLAGGGDNTYLKCIAKKYNIIDKVKFLGSLPHEEIFEYLDNIDIYIQPSKQEGLPRALVEAMSRGCPSLGSTTGGIPELLNKEFIFRNGAVDEICDLLKKIDKETMIKEAKRSFQKAKEYDKKLLDKKRTTFYKEFIENSKYLINK